VPPARLAEQTSVWVSQLRAAGITMNLAPVADTVSITPAAAQRAHRCFRPAVGNDPATVSRAIGAVVPAMQGQRVTAAIKHFPGLAGSGTTPTSPRSQRLRRRRR
jgi:beta-N-acetylhexosaminidase